MRTSRLRQDWGIPKVDLPSNATFRIRPLVPILLVVVEHWIFIGEVERLTPIDDLAVRIVGVLGAEGRPADKTLEHDSTHRPPVASERISLSAKDLRSNIIGCSNSRISEDSTGGLTPGISNTSSIANRKIDLIEIDGVPILFLIRGPFQELLIIGVVMLFVETSR